jgi:hypothetical protein
MKASFFHVTCKREKTFRNDRGYDPAAIVPCKSLRVFWMGIRAKYTSVIDESLWMLLPLGVTRTWGLHHDLLKNYA